MPAGTVVGNISITDYSANDHFTFEILGAPLFMQEGKYEPAKFYEENMQLKSLEPLTSGPYPETATIRVTDSEGYKLEKSFEIVVEKATPAIDIAGNKLLIYPNPADEIIHFNGSDKLVSYRIINSVGVIVATSNNLNSSDIDVSRLQNGLYYLEFSDNTGNKNIQKFIIQR